MNLLSFEAFCHEFWGGKKRAAVANPNPPVPAGPQMRRITVYEVIKDDKVVAELSDIPSARQKAIEVVGRIRVTSKTIEIK